MAAEENDRRILVLLHAAMLSSVGVYGVLLWLLRERLATSGPSSQPPSSGTAWFLLALGAAQYLLAGSIGRRLMAARRREPRDAVRSYFVIRFAAAEAVAVYGLALGLLGSRLSWVVAFFFLSTLALLHAAPGREAYGRALSQARGDAGSVTTPPGIEPR